MRRARRGTAAGPRGRFARGALALLGLVAADAPRAGEFAVLGVPGAQIAALSADGCIAAGGVSGSGGGFRWTVGAGVQRLEAAISVRALSASGRYAAGSSLDADLREIASYWDADGRLHRLGGVPGIDAISVISQAFGVTDAPVVVGSVGRSAAAFVWSAGAGMRLLALPDGDAAARAQGVSDDGRLVFGWSEARDGRRRGVLWADGAVRRPADPAGRPAGELLAANRSGSVLLGLLDGRAAYRWSIAGGAQPLAARAGAQPLQLLAGSDDGRLLVGSEGEGAARRAVAWSADGGLQPLDAWLAARGVVVPPGWRLYAATAIAGHGARIAGWGVHEGRFDAFVADLAAGRDAASRACLVQRD